MVVEVISVVGVAEVVKAIMVVVEEAKCPKWKRRLTHFKTMPQVAGKNAILLKILLHFYNTFFAFYSDTGSITCQT